MADGAQKQHSSSGSSLAAAHARPHPCSALAPRQPMCLAGLRFCPLPQPEPLQPASCPFRSPMQPTLMAPHSSSAISSRKTLPSSFPRLPAASRCGLSSEPWTWPVAHVSSTPWTFAALGIWPAKHRHALGPRIVQKRSVYKKKGTPSGDQGTTRRHPAPQQKMATQMALTIAVIRLPARRPVLRATPSSPFRRTTCTTLSRSWRPCPFNRKMPSTEFV